MTLKLALAQMDIAWHERKRNYETAERLAEKAKQSGAEAVVFPEMFSTGFSMATDLTPEPLSGPTPSFLRSLALKLNLWTVGGFALFHEGNAPKNAAIAITPEGADAALYAKIHLIGLLEEDQHYSTGHLPVLFDLDGVRTSCFICYDLRFPELFRSVADEIDLALVIASWPLPRQSHWEALLKARAIENQCYVAGVNRVGIGGGHEFQGGSMILDPLGAEVARARGEEGVIYADIDREMVSRVRRDFPFLKDRRRHLFYEAACFNSR